MRTAREYRPLSSTSHRVLEDGEACVESAVSDESRAEEDWSDGRFERFEGEVLQRFGF
jgi:hypothetical protein